MNAPKLAAALRLAADALEEGKPAPPVTEPVTPDEAARMLGLSGSTIRRHVAAGNLRAVRYGRRSIRIAKADVEDFRETRAI